MFDTFLSVEEFSSVVDGKYKIFQQGGNELSFAADLLPGNPTGASLFISTCNTNLVNGHKSVMQLFDRGGKLHNEVGPAMFEHDVWSWHINGKFHRFNGPSLTTIDFNNKNTTIDHWYFYGKNVQTEELDEWFDSVGIDKNNITPDDEVLIKMKWGQ